MRTTKKILSMILAFVLVLGLLPATAFATGADSDNIYLAIKQVYRTERTHRAWSPSIVAK